MNNLKAFPQPVQGLERFKVNGLTGTRVFVRRTSRSVYRLEGKIWKPQTQGLLQGSVEITDIASSHNSYTC